MAEQENAMKILTVKEQNNKKGNKCWVYILAFLFPVMIFGAGFALKGVYPFGESSALVVDGVHQYTAFYKELLTRDDAISKLINLYRNADYIQNVDEKNCVKKGSRKQNQNYSLKK